MLLCETAEPLQKAKIFIRSQSLQIGDICSPGSITHFNITNTVISPETNFLPGNVINLWHLITNISNSADSLRRTKLLRRLWTQSRRLHCRVYLWTFYLSLRIWAMMPTGNCSCESVDFRCCLTSDSLINKMTHSVIASHNCPQL